MIFIWRLSKFWIDCMLHYPLCFVNIVHFYYYFHSFLGEDGGLVLGKALEMYYNWILYTISLWWWNYWRLKEILNLPTSKSRFSMNYWKQMVRYRSGVGEKRAGFSLDSDDIQLFWKVSNLATQYIYILFIITDQCIWTNKAVWKIRRNGIK